MTPLHGALALDERHDRAVAIAEQLNLDVARTTEPALDEHRAVAECRLRLGSRRAQRAVQILGARHHAHALAAAACDGLEHQGVADPFGLAEDVSLGRVGRNRGGRARHDRHAARNRDLARRGLAAHPADGRRRRADECQARRLARVGELGVFRQEPVAGMHRVGAGCARGVDDLVDAEVRLARRVAPERPGLVGHAHVARAAIAVGEDGNRLEP